MTKTELIDQIAKGSGLTKGKARIFLNALTDTITDAVADGETVHMVDFGVLFSREHGPRPARNPRTGEGVTIPATRVPAFRVSRKLKAELNGRI